MWICDPDFAHLTPAQTLHRQWSQTDLKYEPDKALENRHMLVRREFSAQADEEMTLHITADDYYKLYLNGELLAMGPAQSYADRQMVNRIELTGRLKPGKNLLAVHVFYMGTLTRAWQSGDGRQGLWMKLTDAQGKTRMESDKDCRVFFPTGWKHRGISGYQTQFIEEVFAEEIPAGWTQPGFDDHDWLAACEHPQDDHLLVEQPTPPVEFYTEKPVRLERRGTVWLADMGREVTGTVQLTARSQQGGVIEFRLGEELNPDGSVRCPMRCNCDYHLWWHLSGRPGEETTDFFDYMAFRYIEVEGPEEAILPDSLCVLSRHYPMKPDVGLFRCDFPLANGIFDICRRGVQLGAQEAFLDCPSREKGQYLGDGTITAHAHLLLTGDPRLYKKMLFDFAASAVICPGLMAVAPGNLMQEIGDYSCQYPEQILTYYQLTGDLQTVRQLMPVVDALEDHFDRHARPDGLIENLTGKWNLVDWPANLRDGYDFPLTEPIGPGVHNVINAFYYGLKDYADRLRALLQLPQRHQAQRVLAAYRAVFRRDNGLFRDAPGSEHTSLHSVALPLYYGMTDRADLPAAVQCIREKGLCCGVYMAYFVLKALARCGEYPLMNRLLFSEDEHSWGNMLREGATSCWEAWGKDQKWNTSLCHPWASAPVILLYEEVAGIQSAQPGFHQLSHAPHAPDMLGDIRLTLGTVRGPLHAQRTNGLWSVHWEKSGPQ